MGAPIAAFTRISDEQIRIHSNIYEPNYVVVIDETLLDCVDVTAGLKADGAIVVNTSKSPEEIKPALEGYKGRICTIDARTISEECIGRNIPNTPMLAAVVKVSGVMTEGEFLKDMESSLQSKFSDKPHVIDGNMKAVTRAVKEVKGV